MKYPVRKELRKYHGINLPMYTCFTSAVNLLMPIIQSGRRLDKALKKEIVNLPNCKAELISPKVTTKKTVMIYYHGGAFIMKTSAYHKNMVQTYAKALNCPVLHVDYRLAPKHKFPIPVYDCLDAYKWAINESYEKIILAGDSAGGSLTLSVMQLINKSSFKIPKAVMLIYPVVDPRMSSDSMNTFTDTPLWNGKQNRRMYELYASKADLHNPLISSLEAKSLSYFPPTYIETAEFDCLRDEGIALSEKLKIEGAEVILNKTEGTLHGYDIEENSEYVKEQVRKRIAFLKCQIDK